MRIASHDASRPPRPSAPDVTVSSASLSLKRHRLHSPPLRGAGAHSQEDEGVREQRGARAADLLVHSRRENVSDSLVHFLRFSPEGRAFVCPTAQRALLAGGASDQSSALVAAANAKAEAVRHERKASATFLCVSASFPFPRSPFAPSLPVSQTCLTGMRPAPLHNHRRRRTSSSAPSTTSKRAQAPKSPR